MVILRWFFISVVGWPLATVLAVFAYKLQRGYEEDPPLAGQRLWARGALTGLAFVLLQTFQEIASFLAVQYLGWDEGAFFWPGWLVIYPMAVVFLVWAFELDNLVQGLGLFLLFLILPLVTAFIVALLAGALRLSLQ